MTNKRLTKSIAHALISIGLLLIALGLLIWLARAGNRPAVSVRDSYRDYPSDILGITEPVEVKNSHYYTDGGTRGIELDDATGNTFAACLDGRLFVVEEGYGSLFIGSVHPTDAAAYSVAIGGPEEAALYAALVRHFDVRPFDPNMARPWPPGYGHEMMAHDFMRILESRLKPRPIDHK